MATGSKGNKEGPKPLLLLLLLLQLSELTTKTSSTRTGWEATTSGGLSKNRSRVSRPSDEDGHGRAVAAATTTTARYIEFVLLYVKTTHCLALAYCSLFGGSLIFPMCT